MSAFAPEPPASASQEFLAGLTATLRRWSALRAGVDGCWGGPQSSWKAECLRLELMEMFYGKKKFVGDLLDIEDFVSEYFEEEFSCLLEDGSPADVAGILYEMAKKCFEGDFSLCRQMVQFAIAEQDKLMNRAPPVVTYDDENIDDGDNENNDDDNDLDEEGDGDGDDDEDNEMDTNDEESASTSTNTLTPSPPFTGTIAYGQQDLFGREAVDNSHLPPPRQLGEPAPEKAGPVIDDDGFQSAAPRRSGRKNKGLLNTQPGQV